MNVVLINQFFPPALAPTGRLLASVAEELCARKHRVTVITSAASYGEGTGVPETSSSELCVIRIGPAGEHRPGIGSKARGYLSFFRHAAHELARLPDSPDVIVCMTTPPFIGQIGARMKRKKGVPYVLWCMDLYPEALAAHGWMGPRNPLLSILKRAAHRERSWASSVIALGPDMASLLERSGASRVVEIPVWSEETVTPALHSEAQALRRERGWAEDEVILLYSGNMGRAHRIEEFVALAKRLRGQSPRCRMVFSGGGPQRESWVRQGAGLIEFLPPVSSASCGAHLLAADIHLVSQQPEWMGVVVPSKFQAACAVGRPVVFAGPPQSAVGIWLAEADAGWILPPEDDAAIEAVSQGVLDAPMRTGKGERASGLFEQRFTRGVNCAKVIEQIERTAKERT